MAYGYIYKGVTYTTLDDAQNAAAQEKLRLENNPTNWIGVKEITGNDEDGWVINPTLLTDEQINNIDNTKTYLAFSVAGSDNVFPLTAEQVTEKSIEFRNFYANNGMLNTIIEVEVAEDGNSFKPISSITPTADLSSYVS